MADYLKSAFNYFSTSNVTKIENEFVGSSLAVGSLTLKVKKVIAEGGYGIVFEAQDIKEGNYYALKKNLSGHVNILKFFNAASVGREKQKIVGTEFLIVTELCTRGQLTSYLPIPRRENPFSPNVILQIFYQTCSAVQHMHTKSIPVIHRDLKVENLLVTENFIIKLCDFGSASTVSYTPDASWSALKRGTVQEELERFTTPMYRAPEMLDLYQNYPIGTASDIWALGCILFYLNCTYHPFEDSSKLAILNANYNLPVSVTSDHAIFYGLIRQTLFIDPHQRVNIDVMLNELSQMASTNQVSVHGSIPLLEELAKRRNGNSAMRIDKPIKLSETKMNETCQKPISPNVERKKILTPVSVTNVQIQPAKPSRSIPPDIPPKQSFPHKPNTSNTKDPVSLGQSNVSLSRQNSMKTYPGQEQSLSSSGNMFSLIKGGAENLFRNIRDASNKVLGSVSANMNAELDLQFITSRIAENIDQDL